MSYEKMLKEESHDSDDYLEFYPRVVFCSHCEKAINLEDEFEFWIADHKEDKNKYDRDDTAYKWFCSHKCLIYHYIEKYLQEIGFANGKQEKKG